MTTTKDSMNRAKALAALCEELDNFEYGRIPMDKMAYEALKEKIRGIGRAANKNGADWNNGGDDDGFTYMSIDSAAAAIFYPNAANTLNRAWHGIGKWEN